MRPLNMIENTGIVMHHTTGAFLGTCVAFRYHTSILTAAHCVSELRAEDIAIGFPGSRAGNKLFEVAHITRHPQADLAVASITEIGEGDITWTQTELWTDISYGVDVATFGYPKTVDDRANPSPPTPRYFRGHVQRFFPHVSHLGYRYFAAELSFRCPAGLSGAPILNTNLHGRLYGIVTENIQVGSEVSSYSEVNDAGERFTERYRDLINYGVCLWLHPLADWLNGLIPPVAQDEMARRGENQRAWLKEESK